MADAEINYGYTHQLLYHTTPRLHVEIYNLLDIMQPQCVTGGDVAREYVWRVNLKETECYWQGWFSGLSKLFLTLSVPKMLILAGVDRLDKELTIGQMQGLSR